VSGKGGTIMKNIKIYSSSSCVNCTAVKEYIKEKGYDYDEKNVSMGYMGVPIIFVNDDVVVGFNRNKLDELL